MSDAIAASYARCQQVARQAARNFYYSFLLLPRAKRQAMCALYAFSRHTDDLADSEAPVAERRAALTRWRGALERALAGDTSHPLLPALAHAVQTFGIPPAELHAIIDGVEMDLDQDRYATFADLERYCHRVASAVGVACIHIWGFRGAAALRPARQCGVAFQLTNILRDLGEDADRGRIYLPQEDLLRFGCREEDLLAKRVDEAFRRLVRFEIERAEACYREAARLADYLEPDGRVALAIMMEIYHGLLARVRDRDGDLFARRVRLPAWRKWQIALRGALRRAWLACFPRRGAPPAAMLAAQPVERP